MNMKDADFEQARKSLESKQKDPKRKRQENIPGSSCAPIACRLLKKRKLKILHDKELSTPEKELDP